MSTWRGRASSTSVNDRGGSPWNNNNNNSHSNNTNSGIAGRGQRGRGRGSRGQGRGWGSPTSANTSVPPSSLGQQLPTLSRNPGTVNSNRIERFDTRTAQNARMTKSRFEFIASVSRSSGLENDGDALKDYRTQEEYRGFIQEKLDILQSRPPLKHDSPEDERKQRVELQENLLIRFRKLREGISSSQRNDQFAVEVYETSLYLSAIYNLPRHTTSVITNLIPEFYLSCPPPRPNAEIPVLVALLHHLAAAHPSQIPFSQLSDSVPDVVFPKESNGRSWLRDLTRALRMRNYYQLERLTQRSTIVSVLQVEDGFGPQAVFCLVDQLRIKARDSAWQVIRSAYKELSCQVEPNGTRDWLTHSLCLGAVSPSSDDALDVDQWLSQKKILGHVQPKEGTASKWIICKVR
ncbi:hypothetical protein BDN72DRAFT_834519 [Pluteus cervinus]|uniref:Uncharacterized protein n=1 Tax=Pluteus cervinus TaxID=181527 RepID=A0ACD3B7S3_9AGAR|nr:hypothetical protein BDN72DRAFT_834519 [Pluteus cervinus]